MTSNPKNQQEFMLADVNNEPQWPTVQAMRYKSKFIDWSTGFPKPFHGEPVTKETMGGIIASSLSVPYSGQIDPETGEPINVNPEYIGLTKGEVIAHQLTDKAANGDLGSIKEVLDRIMGKPKQSVESVGVNMGYQEFLEMLANDEKAQQSATFTNTVDISALHTDPYYSEDSETDDEEWL